MTGAILRLGLAAKPIVDMLGLVHSLDEAQDAGP
jgi:GrpB-like predicted nucleotidyltransferase (UPF0157 family)